MEARFNGSHGHRLLAKPKKLTIGWASFRVHAHPVKLPWKSVLQSGRQRPFFSLPWCIKDFMKETGEGEKGKEVGPNRDARKPRNH